jgi:hypothetical protein
MNSSKNPLYYNLSIINGYDSPRALSPSVIEELNNQVIVEKGTQMYMTVGRFSIPTSTIPYLIVPIQLGQADINKTQYSIQFKLCTAFGVFNETFTQTLSVPFLSQYPLLAPTITPPLITQDVKNSYYWIYDIEQVVLMFNNAFKTLFATFCGQAGLPFAYNSAYFPYITFDSTTRIFSINFTANDGVINYFDQNTGVYPFIVCNINNVASNLYQFTTVNYFEPYVNYPVFYYTISCFDKYNNKTVSGGITQYKMTSSQSSINLWTALNKIIISVGYGISTKTEYDSIPVDNQGSTNSQLVNKPTLPILTDFEVDKDLYAISPNWIQYQTSSITQQRLVGITADEIKNFQLSCYWLDNFGIRHILQLDKGFALTIKLCFYDKNMRLMNF